MGKKGREEERRDGQGREGVERKGKEGQICTHDKSAVLPNLKSWICPCLYRYAKVKNLSSFYRATKLC